ncbi:hypothetical protein A3H26_03670 [candidate division WWE3 bacterium RIFCSPLOWO2_12_FULL_36_10]|uniref:Ribosomal subunit interface protein n=1 Tax=candidate division WWE3 bacterium RIFCSPLOWO2_12_FULL_36_10 TaxID=1802630 RepID=A0A1F4VGM2_UNCKA|nr:MAG: hypothetical protein A3H26_03670 [candidate division WWE3 bacterium RIFCSPLOWO2_12_FULL_36_10]
MSLQITSDNIEITPSMTELAKKKAARLLAKLKDVPDELKNIRLVLNKAPNDFFDVKAEVLVGGTKFFGESSDFTLETALIVALEDVQRQYIKEKSKRENWDKQRDLKRFSTE